MMENLYLCVMKKLKLLLGAILVSVFCPLSSVWAADPLANLITMDYSGKADTLVNVLVGQFLSTNTGTFWAVPRNRPNRESESANIYWQQAHAMDVVIYTYERIRDTDLSRAATYKRYMERWYANHAHNWYRDSSDPTGFLNEYTDDMCWICLTLLHISYALDDDTYANTARTVFDSYILPRGKRDGKGFFSLPWKSSDSGPNACTNAPGCLLAAKLYERYGEESYLQVAKDLYAYQANEMRTVLNNDGRVEEPPLSYTQGTFGEAARRLFHITGERAYLQMAQKVLSYAITSGRCVDNGILRNEGTSMDQSIFKAVLIPYLVNYAIDTDVVVSSRRSFVRFLQTNAQTLWQNLNLAAYPRSYCNYYWKEPFDESTVASMGAMASGASLMENVARMARVLKGDEDGVAAPSVAGEERPLHTFAPNGVQLQQMKRGLNILQYPDGTARKVLKTR